MSDDDLLAILRDPQSEWDAKRDAWAELYSRHQQQALAAAASALGGTSLDPEDVVQEVFVEKITAIVKAYNPTGSSFSTFLCRCVYNAAISARRRLNLRPTRGNWCLDNLSPPTPAPPDILILREGNAEELLAPLPELVRLVLVAHYLEDRPAEEVAAELELNATQVYRLLNRGRQLLRYELAARQVLHPVDDLPAPWEAELLATLHNLAQPRKPFPVKLAGAAEDVVQVLKPTQRGRLLDALTVFLHWGKKEESRREVKLRLWSRNSVGEDGNDPSLLATFDRQRVRIVWECPSNAVPPVEVQLRLDPEENLVSTAAWVNVSGPEAVRRVRLLLLGRSD
jgi:RNA polymerase sigma factor (sigma-70 family)